jgi:hypothetical protein
MEPLANIGIVAIMATVVEVGDEIKQLHPGSLDL